MKSINVFHHPDNKEILHSNVLSWQYLITLCCIPAMIRFTPVINWVPYYITIVYPSRWCVHNAAKKSQVKLMCTKYQRSTTRRRDHGFFSYQKSGHFGKLGRFLANPTEICGTEWRELREITEVHQRKIETKEKRFCKRDKASPTVK